MGKHSHKEKHKKHKKEKKKHKKHEKKRYSSSSASSSSEDEWIEKESSPKPKEHSTEQLKRPQDDWDLFSSVIPASSRPDRKTERDEAKRKEREANQYDPSKCSRELNPYWKDGGDGLPSAKFLKPSDDKQREYKKSSSNYRSSGGSSWRKKTSSDTDRYSDSRDSHDYQASSSHSSSNYSSSGSNWKKKSSGDTDNHSDERKSSSHSSSSSKWRKEETNEKQDSKSTPRQVSPPREPVQEDVAEEILTDKQLNDLAAKLVKAEIMGNDSLATTLKQKLERARNVKKQDAEVKKMVEEEDERDVILTRTDSKGYSRPLSSSYSESDKYGGRAGRKSKKQKVETHSEAGDRMRYFPDDDRHSLQQMFENEKFSGTGDQQEAEFVKMAGRIAKNDDLDDSFADKIRRKDDKSGKRAVDAAIGEHRRTAKSLDDCTRCLQSNKMDKHLMIALGQNAYVALPAHEPLIDGHCLIVPVRHVPCATQLDENEWQDVLDLRRALTRMFAAREEDVVFFETATALNRFPHMRLECVPVPKADGDLAPIYFKKAIDECEAEWATNKKLVSLAGRDVRRAVPKGLSYFSVSFGMQEGYAHVIEDRHLFPDNFAQEIIGGMLDLDHSKWRKPRREQFDAQKERVLSFSKEWTEYDCTKP